MELVANLYHARMLEIALGPPEQPLGGSVLSKVVRLSVARFKEFPNSLAILTTGIDAGSGLQLEFEYAAGDHVYGDTADLWAGRDTR